MAASAVETARDANAKVRKLLARAREALAGKRKFRVEDVREIAKPVAAMAPIIEERQHLRTLEPDLDGQLEAYAATLGELKTTLEQVRFMLLARRAHLEATRAHLETFGLWAATLRQTR